MLAKGSGSTSYPTGKGPCVFFPTLSNFDVFLNLINDQEITMGELNTLRKLIACQPCPLISTPQQTHFLFDDLKVVQK